MFKSWQKRDKNDHEINMTPLIDVSLVLVVMLLLATPLAFESTIGVRGEQPPAQQTPKEDRVESVEVIVVSEDQVRVNGKNVARADLAEVLPPLIKDSSERRVMVGCDKKVSHGAFVNVLDQAKLSGAGEIAVFER